jgi:hypothetical protein
MFDLIIEFMLETLPYGTGVTNMFDLNSVQYEANFTQEIKCLEM